MSLQVKDSVKTSHISTETQRVGESVELRMHDGKLYVYGVGSGNAVGLVGADLVVDALPPAFHEATLGTGGRSMAEVVKSELTFNNLTVEQFDDDVQADFEDGILESLTFEAIINILSIKEGSLIIEYEIVPAEGVTQDQIDEAITFAGDTTAITAALANSTVLSSDTPTVTVAPIQETSTFAPMIKAVKLIPGSTGDTGYDNFVMTPTTDGFGEYKWSPPWTHGGPFNGIKSFKYNDEIYFWTGDSSGGGNMPQILWKYDENEVMNAKKIFEVVFEMTAHQPQLTDFTLPHVMSGYAWNTGDDTYQNKGGILSSAIDPEGHLHFVVGAKSNRHYFKVDNILDDQTTYKQVIEGGINSDIRVMTTPDSDSTAGFKTTQILGFHQDKIFFLGPGVAMTSTNYTEVTPSNQNYYMGYNTNTLIRHPVGLSYADGAFGVNWEQSCGRIHGDHLYLMLKILVNPDDPGYSAIQGTFTMDQAYHAQWAGTASAWAPRAWACALFKIPLVDLMAMEAYNIIDNGFNDQYYLRCIHPPGIYVSGHTNTTSYPNGVSNEFFGATSFDFKDNLMYVIYDGKIQNDGTPQYYSAAEGAPSGSVQFMDGNYYTIGQTGDYRTQILVGSGNANYHTFAKIGNQGTWYDTRSWPGGPGPGGSNTYAHGPGDPNRPADWRMTNNPIPSQEWGTTQQPPTHGSFWVFIPRDSYSEQAGLSSYYPTLATKIAKINLDTGGSEVSITAAQYYYPSHSNANQCLFVKGNELYFTSFGKCINYSRELVDINLVRWPLMQPSTLGAAVLGAYDSVSYTINGGEEKDISEGFDEPARPYQIKMMLKGTNGTVLAEKESTVS